MAQIDPVTGLPMGGLRMTPTQPYDPYGSPKYTPGLGTAAATQVPTGGTGYVGGTSAGGGGGGGSPQQLDWMALIQGNPYFKQAKALLGDPDAGEVGSMGVQNLTDLGNAFKSNVIKFGYQPGGDLSKFPGFNQSYLSQFITPDVQNLASQNQFSVNALQQRAQGETIRDTHAELASRGLLDSGEQNYLLGTGDTGMGTTGGKIGFQYATQEDQNLQQLMGLLSGAQTQFQRAENSRLQQYQAALYNAMMAEIQRAQIQGVPSSSSPSAPTGSTGTAPTGGGYVPYPGSIEDLPGAIPKVPTGARIPVRIPVRPAAP